MSNSISNATVQPNIFRSSSAPTKGQIGDQWVDRGSSPIVLKLCTSQSPLVWTTYATSGGDQVAIQFQDETVNQGTAGEISTVNFTGAGVSAVAAGSTLTVTISGGGPGGAGTYYEIAKWGVD